jgi:hypothetical protein
MPNRKRDSNGRFTDAAFFTAPRDHPYASAAAAAGVAAAGALLWTRRSQIGEAVSSGMDRLSELKSERMRESAQEDYSEEAQTLKESGRKSRGPRGPIAQQEIRSGMARSR